ncbi:MAG: DUF3097 family protein [Microthrixaceae bacterium]
MPVPSRDRRTVPPSDELPNDVLALGNDPIAAGPPDVRVGASQEVVHRATGARGVVDKWHRDWIVLRDRSGVARRVTNLPGGFAVAGETVTLAGVERAPRGAAAQRRTASGSVAASNTKARVARPSRLWVEGDHDARLVERVWGDDLREAAIVVEPLGGIDDLDAAVAQFDPGPEARLAVLVDHLVPGTKEWRLTKRARSDAQPWVTVVGHPFVDVWACVRPGAVGIDAWPEVPRSEEWKAGVCARLGWGTPAEGWARILAAVTTYAQLDASLVGAVEQALDVLVDTAADPGGWA